MERPTLSVVLGVPLTAEGLAARIPVSDWLRKFDDPTVTGEARARALERLWAREYEPFVAGPLCEVVETARGFGATVFQNATLDSFSEALARHGCVVLFAHWKGPDILKDDLISPVDLNAVRRVCRADQSPLGRWLTAKLDVANQVDVLATLRASLTAELDESSAAGDGVTEILEHSTTRAGWRREYLDRLLRNLLRPGNRLELFDDLWPKEAIEAALPSSFTGTLDLTTCTSTLLADFLSARKKGRVRLVQFPTPQDLLWGALCVKSTIKLVYELGLPYVEARQAVGEEMTRLVQQLPTAN